METISKKRKMCNDQYNPELDKLEIKPSAKLEKAKAYFREHGVPDFDKILKETAETKK